MTNGIPETKSCVCKQAVESERTAMLPTQTVRTACTCGVLTPSPTKPAPSLKHGGRFESARANSSSWSLAPKRGSGPELRSSVGPESRQLQSTAGDRVSLGGSKSSHASLVYHVATEVVAHVLRHDGVAVPVRGRVNITFRVEGQSRPVGRLMTMNARLFDVRHADVLGTATGPFASSTLSFLRDRTRVDMTFEAATGAFHARISGVVSIGVPTETSGPSEFDNGDAPLSWRATTELRVELTGAQSKTQNSGTARQFARTRIAIQALTPPGRKGLGHGTPALGARVEFLPLVRVDASSVVDVHMGWNLVEAKVFSIQPVFIRVPGERTTGRSFAFGRPALVSIWERIGVLFAFRPAIFLNAPMHRVMRARVRDSRGRLVNNMNGELGANGQTIENGVYDLAAKVAADDAVRVFFVERLINVATPGVPAWGGGRTFMGGAANAFVITSDENANGVELHHLAHEVGHAIGFRHPGLLPTDTQVPALPGTVMCPSGFLEDNPDINSRQHYDMVASHYDSRFQLLDFRPDCDAECGECRGVGEE